MSQPRQILHLISALDGYGESRQLRLLVEQHLADGYAERIVTFSADRQVRSALEAQGVACRVFEKRWEYDPVVAWRLAQELRQPSHDILHVWGLSALRYANWVRSRSTTTPCVATLEKLPAGRGHVVADCIVVPSDAGGSDEHSTVIPPAVATSASAPMPRSEFLEQFALSEDSRTIAIAGPLARSRHIDDAIWCSELARILDERVRLLIFGDGAQRHRLERFARLASDPNAIRFLGYRADLLQLLPHIDVFWQPGDESSTSGAAPMALLEAMAAQTPVVATDVPGHCEVIEPGRTGYLFPVGSRAICVRHTMRLLQDAEHSRAIARAASREVIGRFSLEAFSRAYAELYQRLLA